jgi:dihydrofolate synthase/folylpolyglutamate synthase
MVAAAFAKQDGSAAILERFRSNHARRNTGDINLTLRPAYRDVLEALGKPNQKLPPVFHVAGTNGKGSTCAFLRAMLEAEGYKVHVYTSPHLIHFHERIRIAGDLIGENELADVLRECEKYAPRGGITYFEAATAAAFVAFARHKADFTILETGLGGRLDATNVVDNKIATLITRLSFDHCEYLGPTLTAIAREKAGIMCENVPCFAAPQPDADSLTTLHDAATSLRTTLAIGDKDWHVTPTPDGFRFVDKMRRLDLPYPALLGQHQCINAGLAIAAASVLPTPLSTFAIIHGLQSVEWPARLQRLRYGVLADFLPPLWELWLDGGHNDSAGEVLAVQARAWQIKKPPSALHLIMGMLTTKNPHEFLGPLMGYISGVTCVDIPKEPLAFGAEDLAAQLRAAGVANVGARSTLPQALKECITGTSEKKRIMICGSLYLAGHALTVNGAG